MKKELLAKLFKMAPDTGTGGAEKTKDVTNDDDNVVEPNTFKAPQTQSELDSITNKAVQKALENYKAGEKKRIAEAIKKEKDYASLSDDERDKKEFEDQQAAFAKEKAAFEHEKLVVQVEKDLISKGLPAEFAELLAVGDAATALAQVGKFEVAFNAAVSEKVKESLRQPAPESGGNGSSQVNYGARLAEGSHGTGGEIF